MEEKNPAKEFLQKVKIYDSHINEKLEELARLKELTTKITASYGGDVVSGTHNQDKLGDAVAKIADLESDIDNAVDAYVDKKKEVSAIIDKIDNPNYIDILYKRYFGYKSWESIACEMNYTYQWVCELHGRALQEVKKLLKTQKS